LWGSELVLVVIGIKKSKTKTKTTQGPLSQYTVHSLPQFCTSTGTGTGTGTYLPD